MSDYRDPKVTTPSTKSGSAGSEARRWIVILAVVVLLILVIAWLWGGYGERDVEVAEPLPATPGATAPAEPVVPPATEGATTPPAEPAAPAEGTAPAPAEPVQQ